MADARQCYSTLCKEATAAVAATEEFLKTRFMDWTYRSFKDAMFPISFGILPLNSFHMKSLPKENKRKMNQHQ